MRIGTGFRLEPISSIQETGTSGHTPRPLLAYMYVSTNTSFTAVSGGGQ